MKSEAFERNTAKVADVVDRVPKGQVTTYGAIGKAIGIVPRYVALIMASAPEISATQWHRVVGGDATVRPGGHHAEQMKRLRSEGLKFNGDKIIDFKAHLYLP